MSKVKYIGNGKVVDTDTGEVHTAPEVLKQTKHENFVKVEFMAMAAMIDNIGNKKMKVVQYIMDHMANSSNTLNITQRELSKAVGVGITTVEDTIKGLRRANLIETRTGAIMLSPHLYTKGYPQHYGYLLVKFEHFNNKKKSVKSARSSIKTTVGRKKQPTNVD